jgi:hypothetical protein
MLLKLKLGILVPSLNARLCLWLRVGRALARNAVVLFSVALLFSIGLSVETWVSTWCARVSLPSQTAERWIHARPNTTLQAREDGDSAREFGRVWYTKCATWRVLRVMTRDVSQNLNGRL